MCVYSLGRFCLFLPHGKGGEGRVEEVTLGTEKMTSDDNESVETESFKN